MSRVSHAHRSLGIKMHKVVCVEPLPNYRLRVRFDNGFEGIYDMGEQLWGDMAKPLKDPSFFAKVFLSRGVITWPNDFDMCSDALYYRMSGEPLPEGCYWPESGKTLA